MIATRFASLVLISLTLPALLAGAVHAASWQGEEVEKDGVIHVRNPAQPMEPPVALELEELWRLGGESEADEEFFGVIGSIVTDEGGNVYLMDRQLSEVRVFSRGGEYLRTIGREGEGPGEFRRPSATFFTPDGKLAVVQVMPGKIVLLTPEGDPAGEFPRPEDDEGQRQMIWDGAGAKDRIVLATVAMSHGTGKMIRDGRLAAYGDDGAELTRYYEAQSVLNFANPVVDETKGVRPEYALARDGTLYAVTRFGEYEIRTWSPDGTLARVIEREYEHLRRTEEEKAQMRKRFIIRGPIDPKILVSDDAPDVRQLHARDDGTLWVLTSQGAKNSTEETIGVFDVFDEQGRFLRQVTLLGQGDPEEDKFFFVGDRLFVVTEYTQAMNAMFGGQDEEDEEILEGDPMEVICYRLGPVTAEAGAGAGENKD